MDTKKPKSTESSVGENLNSRNDEENMETQDGNTDENQTKELNNGAEDTSLNSNNTQTSKTSNSGSQQSLSFVDVVTNGLKLQASDLIKKGDESKKQVNNKIPPIEVQVKNNQERAHIQNITLQNMNTEAYSLINTKSAIKFHLMDMESHKQLIEVFQANKIEFHTYAIKEKQNKAFIMRGLPTNYIQSTELLEIFKSVGLEIISCYPFETGYSKNNNSNTNLWKIICGPETTIDDISEYKLICNASVKFEPIKRKGAIQCKNCQGFQHTASNCNREYRCVKCGNNHEIGNCSIVGYNKKKVKCANCGKNHTANNLTVCEYFIEKILPLSKKNKLRKTNKEEHKENAESTNKQEAKSKPRDEPTIDAKESKKPKEAKKKQPSMEDRLTKIEQQLNALLKNNSNNKKKKKKKKQ